MADYAKLVPGTRVAMTSENGGLRMGTVKAQQPAGMIDVNAKPLAVKATAPASQPSAKAPAH